MLKRAVTDNKDRQTTACKHYLLHVFTQQTAGQGPTTINVRQWNITVQCWQFTLHLIYSVLQHVSSSYSTKKFLLEERNIKVVLCLLMAMLFCISTKKLLNTETIEQNSPARCETYPRTVRTSHLPRHWLLTTKSLMKWSCQFRN
jgi:hypothetical protein